MNDHNTMIFNPFLPDPNPDNAQFAWQIPYETLIPHYADAMIALELSPFLLEGTFIRRHGRLLGLPPAVLDRYRFVEGHVVLTSFDFRRRFIAALRNHDRATLMTDARVIDFRTTGGAAGKTVEACTIRRLGVAEEREVSTQASAFVIAAGPLETTRLLLASDFAGHLPSLGRGFVEHPYLWHGGQTEPFEPVGDWAQYFAPAPITLTSNVGILPIIARTNHCHDSTLPIRFVTGGLHQSPGTVNASWETLATAEAYVRLQPHSTDRLGMPFLELASGSADPTLRLADAGSAVDDLFGLIRNLSGSARLTRAPFEDPLDQWSADYRISPGNHPAGTCRMSADARSGVVDTNCRVHGVENLYLASAAVFPNSGYANPTLTVMALANRLAGHLVPLVS